MATFTKRSGKWQARVRHKSLKGGSKSKSFTKKAFAERWALDLEAEIQKGLFVDTKSSEQIMMADLLLRYQKEICIKNSKSTQKNQTYIIKRLIKYVTDRSVIECDEDYWFSYSKARREVDGVSADTLIKDLQILKGVYDACLTLWKIKLVKNPITTTRSMLNQLGHLDGANRQHATRIPPKVIEQLEAYQPKRFSLGKYGALFAIESMMRLSEVAEMKWSNINWESNLYKLDKEKNDHKKRIIGQGRYVPLGPKAIEILKYVKEQRMAGKADYGEYVWPWRDSRSLSRSFRRIQSRIGIIEKFRFHDTRHEGVSRLVDKNIDTRIVGEAAGHKDARSQWRYSHPDMAEFAKTLHGITNN